jgi:DNA-binding beta-propeller fold protein YncE
VSEDNSVVPGSFAPGSRIAGYLLEEQIGQGGMAVVFRAHDERLDRTVALKILAPALAADEAFRQRFIRESRAAAAVDDPHIIPVFEAGEARGVLFIAMRYVRGGDVRSLVTQLGPLPPGRVAEIISQVATALDAAHGRGLVHRDVKPANMLLDSSGGAGRPDHVYLSDFGLSKGSLQATGLTGTGVFLGTLDYIAPEQIEGRPVDGRADLYALACAAFELLTGVPPFQRDEAMAVMYAQLSEPPPALTSRRPDLPVAANAVFARALAKAPADRYRSCRDFSDALRDALEVRPYDSGPGSIPGPDHPATQVARSRDEATRQGGAPAGAAAAAAAAGPDASGAGVPHRSVEDAGQPTVAAGSAHGMTSPDQTAPHWQQGPGQYGGQYGSASGRRGRRFPALLAIGIAAVLIVGGGGAYFALKGPAKPDHPAAAVLTAPGCSTTAAPSHPLAGAKSSRVNLDTRNPFSVTPSHDGKFAFVVTDTSVLAYAAAPDGMLTYKWQYTIASPSMPATGSALTTNHKYMLVAVGNGLLVLSISQLEIDAPGIEVGTLTVPGISGYGRAIGVAVSPHDQYAFVTMQFAGVLAVFKLGDAATTGDFPAASYVGSVHLPVQPVGVAVSPNGDWIYVTSFQSAAHVRGGLLSVLSAATAETSPASSVKVRVAAGCNPARVAVSPDGSTVWVTVRQSNALLGYSASKLISDPHHALVAKVGVGQAPIGVILNKTGTQVLVADDNQSGAAGASNVAVVGASAALHGSKHALLGYIPSGAMPHEVALSPGGRFLYVTDRGSAQLQVVDLNSLP